MARRNVLNGASAWEREEKANHQRDYAAQLQQQVLQKQAKQEQEKARRQQEQREELELLERERTAATRKHQSQQELTANDPPPPAPSPQRAVSMPHMPAVELQQQQGVYMTSPLKFVSAGSGFASVGASATEPSPCNTTSTPAIHFGSESYMPAFGAVPSIFESLLREPGISTRSTPFYDDLAALQRLAIELDSHAKQRRSKAQSNYIKANFLHDQDTVAEVPPFPSPFPSPVSLRSPAKFSDDKGNLKDNQLDNLHAVPHSRKQSDGLLGESMLLPLTTTLPFSNSTVLPCASDSQVKSIQEFDAVVKAEEDCTAVIEDLDNHSEMVRISASAKQWQR